MARGIVALVFRCSGHTAAPSTTAEAVEVRWLNAAEISDLMEEAYAVRMLDALTDGPPAIRSHDGIRVTTDEH